MVWTGNFLTVVKNVLIYWGVCFFITLLFAFETNQNMFRYEKEIILVDHHLRGKQEASLVQCDIHESYDSFQTNCDHDIWHQVVSGKLVCRLLMWAALDLTHVFFASFKSFLNWLDGTILSICKYLIHQIIKGTVAFIFVWVLFHFIIFS